MRLAEVYGVEVETVFYGKSRAQTEERELEWTAGIVLAAVLALTLLRAVLLWLADRLFHIPGQAVTTETGPLVDAHFAMLDVSNAVGGLASLVLGIGGVVLLVLLWRRGRPLPLKWKLCYAGGMVAGMAACTIPLAWTDGRLGWADYMLFPELMTSRLALFLLLSILMELLKKRRKR